MTSDDRAKPQSFAPSQDAPPFRPGDGDGWIECTCGRKHWGLNGAAGLLLTDKAQRVLLQHRAIWSHQGGTWGIPGGARGGSETALQAALRETEEEAGIDPKLVIPTSAIMLDHGTWSYTTILGNTRGQVHAQVTDRESVEVSWIPPEEVANRELLVAFGQAWPLLRVISGVQLTLIVDAANLIGSKPFAYVANGWWTDRAAAAKGLYQELVALAETGISGKAVGMPGDLWWPKIVMVVEGEARAFTSHITSSPEWKFGPVDVVSAPGEGDDEVVNQTVIAVASTRNAIPTKASERESADDPPGVVVVTADRELRTRVAAVGGCSIGPQQLKS